MRIDRLGRVLGSLLLAVGLLNLSSVAFAAGPLDADEYRLADGDSIRIVVFQNPDLTLETRVSERGSISFPLIGGVAVGGMTISAAETLIADKLQRGGFVSHPQVNISLLVIVGNTVSVLGQVNKPGTFPLLTFNTHVSQMLAAAGGIAPTGGDLIVLTGTRDGKPMRRQIDIEAMFAEDGGGADMLVAGGDSIYVSRAPVFYIYGEVQKPGMYVLQRDMTVMQTVAAGGGLTPRGTERALRLFRRDPKGVTHKMSVALTDPVKPGDVISVSEGLF
jgi:polysaccharide export outer membrane protein